MLFKQHDKSSPLNSIHYAMLYPQNGDRIVAVDYVTSLYLMYNKRHSKFYFFKLQSAFW